MYILLLLLERANWNHLAQRIRIERDHRAHIALVIRQDKLLIDTLDSVSAAGVVLWSTDIQQRNT